MNKIIIDEEKCIGCSLCVNDCPNCCLHLEYGKAHADNTGCIECGHCYAVCPQGAIRMSEYKCEDEPVVPMTEIDSDTLLSGMRSRRTIRHFTTQPVEEEKIRKILEAGRYSPTGGNSQNVAFTILGSRQAEAEAICVDLFRNGQKLGAKLADFIKRINITDNFFFKGAPPGNCGVWKRRGKSSLGKFLYGDNGGKPETGCPVQRVFQNMCRAKQKAA